VFFVSFQAGLYIPYSKNHVGRFICHLFRADLGIADALEIIKREINAGVNVPWLLFNFNNFEN
jgi:hypothetical protein